MRKSKPSTKEYVYLLQEREFIRLEEPTYKIGRTKDPDRRHKAYPKDSELLMLCQVPDCQSAEKQIKEVFSEKFTQRREYGVEYFNGNVELMMSLMSSIVYPVERPFGNLFRRKPLPQRPSKSLTTSNETSPQETKKTLFSRFKSMIAPKKPLPPLPGTKDHVEPVVKSKKRVAFRPQKFLCKKCPKRFRSQQALDKHIRREITCDFKCRKCQYVGESKNDLKTHIKYVHV